MKGSEKKSGFTLLELIVVIGMFAVILTAVAGIYLSYTRTQRRLTASERVVSAIRLANELVARDLRSARIDYADAAYSGGPVQPEQALALIDADGNPVRYELNGSCLERTAAGVTAPVLDCSLLSVVNADFYIGPTSDPFADPPTVHEQPYVTYNLTFQTLPAPTFEQRTIYLQNTVSTRVYLR